MVWKWTRLSDIQTCRRRFTVAANSSDRRMYASSNAAAATDCLFPHIWCQCSFIELKCLCLVTLLRALVLLKCSMRSIHSVILFSHFVLFAGRCNSTWAANSLFKYRVVFDINFTYSSCLLRENLRSSRILFYLGIVSFSLDVGGFVHISR